MRNGLIALALLGFAAGCTSSISEEGASQESNATEASLPLASSLTISEVAVFQSLKVTVEKNGAAVPASLPILANRDSMVRVYVNRTATPAQEVTAVLEVAEADGDVIATFRDTKTIESSSTEADLASTFFFNVPAANLPVGVKFRVALTAAAGMASSSASANARFPANGSLASLGMVSNAQQLRIVFVPVHYTFNGADLLPDTSPEQMERHRRVFMSLYPVANVEMVMHAPYEFSTEIGSSGAGFGKVLREMLALRNSEAAPPDVYYYGAFNPKATMQEYCAGGCVTGLSGLYGPDTHTGRASVGVGFTGTSSSYTFAHEVGHAHGRPHAPCGGAAGPDPSFPHAGGSTGVWAFSSGSQKLVDPGTAKDLMGYCQPKWISDYNFKKLLERLTYVNNVAATATPPGAFAVKLPYRFVEVNPDGTLTLGDHIDLVEEPQGDKHAVQFRDANGKTVAKADAVFTAYDHLDGGYALIPEVEDAATINIDGLGVIKR